MRRLILLAAVASAVAAVFVPTASAGLGSILVTVSPSGTGAGVVNGPGISCSYAGGVPSGDCAQLLATGVPISLTATASAGSAVASVSGCPTGVLSGGQTAKCSFLPGPTAPDVNLGVTFVVAPFTLTVTKNGTGGGTVVSAPPGIQCGVACQAQFVTGTLVQLTATPDATSRFVTWGGACAAFGSNRTCFVQMSASRTVTATFDTNLVTVTVAVAGSGTGRVTGSPGNYYCPPTTCSARILLGTVMSFTATPSPGSLFGGWGGPCTGTSPACSFTVTGATTLTATFDPAPVEAEVIRVQAFRKPYRYVRVIINSAQSVRVDTSVTRSGSTLGSRTIRTTIERRTFTVAIRPGARAGSATVTVEFTNEFGRTKTETRTVTIPRR